MPAGWQIPPNIPDGVTTVVGVGLLYSSIMVNDALILLRVQEAIPLQIYALHCVEAGNMTEG
jgi:hypothetical protein